MDDTSSVPVEPPPGPWAFPTPREGDDLVGVGADLAPGTILAAYRSGLFPMPVGDPSGGGVSQSPLGWWSPARRGVLPLEDLRVSRSLAKSCGLFDVRVDTAFDEVIDGCADTRREKGWISDEIKNAYKQLHRLGWVHSVEAWSATDGLAGGLYGVAIGGLFAGESMFHHVRDASKVALVGLVNLLRESGSILLDVQWLTPHLASLGAMEINRADYQEQLAGALRLPLPSVFSGG